MQSVLYPRPLSQTDLPPRQVSVHPPVSYTHLDVYKRQVLKNNKALSLIGLATKAGKTVSGEFSTEKSIKTGKGYLAIVAGDSSDNTKKKFRNMCEFYEVPLYILSDKETLGHAMGKEFRASLAVQDWNFAEAIRKVLQDEGKEL